MRIPRRGQSVSEYTICVAVIILAMITIQSYVKRGLQGRYADLVDRTARQVSPSSARPITQYEPYYVHEYSKAEQGREIDVVVNTDGRQRIAFSGSLDDFAGESVRGGLSIQEIDCYD
ncbi:hypothetical protein ACFL1D_00045 [Candidatus Omnitrophota bacterium]